MKHAALAGVALLLAGLAALQAEPASAAIRKCKTASGAVIYTDKPCTRFAPRPQAPDAPAQPEEPPADDAQPPSSSLAIEPPPDTEAGSVGDSEAAPETTLPTEPLRPAKKAFPGHRAVLLGALGATAVCWILMIVNAFRNGSTAWGILLILLSPATMVLYGLIHWERAKKSFVASIASMGIAYAAWYPPVDMIEVSDSYLTANQQLDISVKAPRERFSSDDTVVIKTVLSWEDRWVETLHLVSWIWYANGSPVANNPITLSFDSKPYVLMGTMPAAQLGPGAHRVEVYVDGRQLDAREFEVR